MAVDEILEREVCSSHSVVAEDLFLWGVALRVLVDPEADRTIILRNVVSYTPNVTASHLMRLPTYIADYLINCVGQVAQSV
jgi:hypothetical protein